MNKIKHKIVTNFYHDCGLKKEDQGLTGIIFLIRSFPSMFYQYYRLYQTIKLLKKFSIGKRVLDAPCGWGYVLKTLPKSSVGLDINQNMLTSASKIAPGKKIIKGDLAKLPFPKNYFTAVLSLEIFEHLPDPNIIVKEYWRVLKPNGLMIITAPTKNFLWKVRFLFSSMYKTEPHCNTFSVDDLLKFYKKYKYSLIDARTIVSGLNHFIVLQKKY